MNLQVLAEHATHEGFLGLGFSVLVPESYLLPVPLHTCPSLRCSSQQSPCRMPLSPKP